MKALLFVLLFAGILLVIAGFLLKDQPGNSWQGLLAAGMALEAISIGLLLWKFVVSPHLRKT